MVLKKILKTENGLRPTHFRKKNVFEPAPDGLASPLIIKVDSYYYILRSMAVDIRSLFWGLLTARGLLLLKLSA